MTKRTEDGAVQHIRNAVVSRREGGSIFRRGINAFAEIDATAKSLALADGKTITEVYLERGELYYEKKDYDEALKWFRLGAEQGDASAQVRLGLMHEVGRGVNLDILEAVRWYRLAAEKGDKAAHLHLGFMYEIGRGVCRDKVEAVRRYRLAAERDEYDLQEDFEIAELLWNSTLRTEKCEAIFCLCRSSAEHGNARAQTLLGSMYEFGHAVPSDNSEAIKWYEAAANQGHADAQVRLGRLLYKLYRASALPKDYSLYERATQWFRQAAEQGNADGAYELARKRYKVGNYYGTDQDAEAAAKWYRVAANKGHIEAQCEMGVAYTFGHGVPKDHIESIRWYRLAADGGDSHAQACVGYGYLTGKGVPQSLPEAIKWFRLAAQDDGGAQEVLADMYATGEGAAKNLVVAYALYSLHTNNDASKSETLAGLIPQMNLAEIKAAKSLSESMAKPGNLLTALDEYIAST
jgi:TPR repeat protein